MTQVNVSQRITVPLADGQYYHIVPGLSDVPDEVAAHPFVAAYAAGMDPQHKTFVEGNDGLMIEADEAGQLVARSSDVSGFGLPGLLTPDAPNVPRVPWASRTHAQAAAKAKNDREQLAAVDDRIAAERQPTKPPASPPAPPPPPRPSK